jgi:hypothetical protein
MRCVLPVLIVSLIMVPTVDTECFAANSPVKVKTIICAKPVFPELHRLKDMLVEDPNKLEFVKSATFYLLKKYCAATNQVLTPSRTEKINQYCDMHSDTTSETPVFWETCRAVE